MKKKNSNKLLLLWYSHPRIAIALILVAINLLIIMLFTAILALISNNGFFDELSYLFTYTMCSDGIYDFVNNQEDVACFVVKILLTIIQMIIFSGALIGFTTDLLQNTFDKRLENKDKMLLKNHFVFLNWSTIGQNIIYDLSFLEGEKTVVILAEEEREEILTSIDNIFTAMGRKKKGLRIFVKKGDPTSSKHLNDISISEASHIGILLSNQQNTDDNAISTKDLTSFKLLLTMIGESPNANIVVETQSELAKSKIEQLLKSSHPQEMKRVSVFSHNAVMGHVLGRTVINPAFSYLFHNILSFDGAEFYGIPTMDIEEALTTFNDCIPIVNYDDDDEIDQNGNKKTDQLYILSDTEDTLGVRECNKSYIKDLNYSLRIEKQDFSLFIFSDSDRAQFVITELKNNNISGDTNIRYQVFSYQDDLNEIIQKIEKTTGERKILLLSKEEFDSNNQDSDVFLSLLELKQSKIIATEVEIFVEVVNVDNVTPVKNLGIATVILSNKIISLYMLQLLTHVGSRKFFKDVLLSNAETGEIDFEINTAKEMLTFEKDTIEFSCYSQAVQSFYKASNKTRMLVGYFPDKNDKSKLCFFCDQMDKERNLVIHPTDELITISYTK